MPPTDTEFEAILKASGKFGEVAPFSPEVIQLAAETGLRESELFHLCWRSVDLSLGDTGALRIEEQQRSRVVGGKPWKPKYLKFRVVPLTTLARQILDDLRGRVASEPDDLVVPNRGGAPYVRIEHAPELSGIGRWHDVLKNCHLYGKVRFHDLRHVFAVRCLERGVPIAAVSSWLGHSDVNLTVKRYGRWSHEAREQWEWIKKLDEPIDAIAKGPWLRVHEGGRSTR
jgi:integrase